MLWVNYISIKLEQIKLHDCFVKWLQLLGPNQWCRRALVDLHSLHTGFDQSWCFNFGHSNGDEVVSCGEVFCIYMYFFITLLLYLFSLLKPHNMLIFTTFHSKITLLMYDWYRKCRTYLMYATSWVLRCVYICVTITLIYVLSISITSKRFFLP